MKTPNLTRRLQEALDEGRKLAEGNSNTFIEIEHVLKSILRGKSVLNKVISNEEVNEILRKVNEGIINLAKYTSSGTVSSLQPSHELLDVIRKASDMNNDEFLSVPMFLLAVIEKSRCKIYFTNPEKIVTGLRKLLAEKKMDSLESDDPENSVTKFAVDMIEEARNNKYDPVIGREDEIRQVMEILIKKTKANALLVGEPGTGKTAIVKGLAQKIAKDESNMLNGYKLYSVDVGALVAGTSYRGQFEERLRELIKESENDKKVILFIDEAHIILGAGSTNGSLDAANMLKPSLASGALKVIAATTYDEYREHIMNDPAFERRFTKVIVEEQTIDETVTVMRGLRERIEMHFGVKISDQALVFASKEGKRYIPSRRLPDLAIELIEYACASTLISLDSVPPNLGKLQNKLWSLEVEKTSIEIDLKRLEADLERKKEQEPALQRRLVEIAEAMDNVREQMKPLEEEFNKKRKNILDAKNIKRRLEYEKMLLEKAIRERDKFTVDDITRVSIPMLEKELAKCNSNAVVIDVKDVAEVISRLTKIPVSRLTQSESEKILGLPNQLMSNIFGQDDAIRKISDSIYIAKAGLGCANRPIASFLLLGPTGVGKTEVSKLIADELFGGRDKMIILDMSDYASEISLTKLLGAPAGYVGCEKGGTLTEPVKKMPYNILLLDEFDHANPTIRNVMYQLLDEGRVVDGRGVNVDFRNTIIFMTSNIGQEYVTPQGTNAQAVLKLAESTFGAPFMNRLDNVIIFNQLNQDALEKVVYKEIKEVNKNLADKKAVLTISPAVINELFKHPDFMHYGARAIKRIIRNEILVTVSKQLLSRVDQNTPIRIEADVNENDFYPRIIFRFYPEVAYS